MRKQNKKTGFTLIELLAVIVILAIVALIAMPLIMGVIEKAQISSYKNSLVGIFDATDLYVASDQFNGFPSEGINVTDTNIKMKNKTFTTGKIMKNDEGQLYLDRVSDGTYCGSGTLTDLVVVEGSCDQLDTTPPVVSIASNSVTSNAITIVATATDPESGINGYEFSKDNGSTWTSKQTSNIYEFTGLTNDTNYEFVVRAYNNETAVGLSDRLTVKTSAINLPTFSITPTGWSQSKTVTITYPERQTGYVYEYSLDNASTWEEVITPSTTKDITFNSTGSVIARISDGVNEVSTSSYDITNIDTTAPVITVTPTSLIVAQDSTYTNVGVSASDDMLGDITNDIVVTGSVDTSTVGTYTLTYNVSDLAGNAATQVSRTVQVVNAINNFTYTGAYQTFTVPYTGTYQLEVWGAQGGGYGSLYDLHVGKGGYSTGEISLSAGQQLYVYVGEKPQVVEYYGDQYGGWNGGGRGGSRYGAGGGGASDIRIGGNSLTERIIVAGGGGGSYGGDGDAHGGGTSGSAGGITETNSGTIFHSGEAGTQTGGGAGGVVENPFSPSEMGNGGNGTLGQGGDAATLVEGGGYAGGGGGGYYGGGAGAGSDYYGGSPGGGGSGYVGGVSNGETLAGSGYIPSPTGGTEHGHVGHGYARITFLSQ